MDFANYEPDKFLQQAKYKWGRRQSTHGSGNESGNKDAARLTKWANENKVSVILSETGCIGYVDGKTEGPRNRETAVVQEMSMILMCRRCPGDLVGSGEGKNYL